MPSQSEQCGTKGMHTPTARGGEAGSVSNTQGVEACAKECMAGSYSNANGTMCVACPLGYVSEDGAASCSVGRQIFFG